MSNQKIRVLVVDDSPLFRTMITSQLEKSEDIQPIGTACDTRDAREKILRLKPDVVTMDVEMPGMSGIDFIRQFLPEHPVPVVIVTSSAVGAFEAMTAGAVEYIKKPEMKGGGDIDRFGKKLCNMIRVGKSASLSAKRIQPVVNNFTPLSIDASKNANKVIAIGASTGGTDALLEVVKDLPTTTPGIIIVQHMPAGFTKMYADRMNSLSKMRAVEATDGERVETGKIIIAAGEYQMRLCKDARGYYVSSKRGEKVSGHCPSVDVMFDSVADTAGSNAIGVILTGMGSDGAKGLLKMKNRGAFTIGQNQESCVVYGMPCAAYNMGAVCIQSHLSQIASVIVNKLK